MDPVSSESEQLILVDHEDRVLGSATKAQAHDGEGLLHRAFSIFLFNGEGEVLLQQRSPKKRLWPGAWSNTCCSHPRQGEELVTATQRRLQEELGLGAPLRFLFKFEYHARYEGLGAEHELCSVFVGRTDATPRPHPEEIAELRWMSPAALTRALAAAPASYTPWLKLEWERLTSDFSAELRP